MIKAFYITFLSMCMGFVLNAKENVDTAIYTIPFVKAHGLILLESQINEDKGFFIFDTGADALLLNSNYNESKHNNQQVEFQSLTGVVNSSELDLQNITLGDYSINNIEAYSVDLSEIEALADRKLLGIIGASILNSDVVHIDNRKHIIQLLPRTAKDFLNDRSLVKSEIGVINGIPIIPITIKGKPYAFGLDTGSSVSLISSELVKAGVFKEKSKELVLRTAADNTTISKVYSVDKVRIANLSIEALEFGESSFKEINAELGIHLDGILSIDQIPADDIYIDLYNGLIFINI